jgi:hypothetical protein
MSQYVIYKFNANTEQWMAIAEDNDYKQACEFAKGLSHYPTPYSPEVYGKSKVVESLNESDVLVAQFEAGNEKKIQSNKVSKFDSLNNTIDNLRKEFSVEQILNALADKVQHDGHDFGAKLLREIAYGPTFGQVEKD